MKKYIIAALLIIPSISSAATLPAFPMAFYGNATLNGVTAPAGTVIRAYYGSQLAGQATVDGTGAYGYASSTAAKLLVSQGTGAITFSFQAPSILNGQESTGNVPVTISAFQEGTSMLDNMNFTYTVFTSGGGGGGSSSSGGGGGYVAPVPTVTPVATPAAVPGCPVGFVCARARTVPAVATAPVPTISGPLSVGSSDPDVLTLQEILASLGYLNAKPSGYFGPATRAAVKAFQKANKLPQVGSVGPLTLAALNKSAKNMTIPTSTPTVAADNSVFARDLTIGSSGPDVLALQKYLNAHGFTIASAGPGSAGNETSDFGKKTRTALGKFQSSVGISPASGYFGPATRAYVSSH